MTRHGSSNHCLRLPATAAGLSLALIAMAGCGATERPAGPELEVEDVWVRAVAVAGDAVAPEPGTGHPSGHGAGPNTAAYLTLRSHGGEADRLVDAATEVASAVELHRTEVVDGVMRMRQVEDGVPIAPGSTVELRPGGLHIMLMGVSRTLAPGDRVDLTLHFERAGPVTAKAEVRER